MANETWGGLTGTVDPNSLAYILLSGLWPKGQAPQAPAPTPTPAPVKRPQKPRADEDIDLAITARVIDRLANGQPATSVSQVINGKGDAAADERAYWAAFDKTMPDFSSSPYTGPGMSTEELARVADAAHWAKVIDKPLEKVWYDPIDLISGGVGGIAGRGVVRAAGALGKGAAQAAEVLGLPSASGAVRNAGARVGDAVMNRVAPSMAAGDVTPGAAKILRREAQQRANKQAAKLAAERLAEEKAQVELGFAGQRAAEEAAKQTAAQRYAADLVGGQKSQIDMALAQQREANAAALRESAAHRLAAQQAQKAALASILGKAGAR